MNTGLATHFFLLVCTTLLLLISLFTPFVEIVDDIFGLHFWKENTCADIQRNCVYLTFLTTCLS